jgi:hypothetical protein
MRKLIAILFCAFLSLGVALGPVRAGAPPVPNPVCAYCGVPVPNGVHKKGCPYYVAPQASGGSKHHYSGGGGMDMQSMIVGTIFGSLLGAVFAPPNTGQDDAEARKQQEAAALEAQKKAAELAAKKNAEMRAKEAAAQAEFERMMQSYKQLEGAAKATNPNAGLGLKTLDGDMETLAANARQPFDTGGLGLKGLDSAPPAAPAPTPFFGDTMPVVDIQRLVNPDTDPRVVDLREAKKFVVENLKKEPKEPAPDKEKDKKGDKKPAAKTPDCERLAAKLSGFLEQRQKFNKTILMAQEQLDTWREANRNALLNAAKDGFEYFAGQYLEALNKRGRAAERYKGILEKRAEEMARDGLDVAAIRAKIDRMAKLSTTGQVAELTNKLNDWTTFAKDGLSAMLAQLADSDAEVKAMLEDPKVGKYFQTDAPALNALFDLSKILADSKVFGKWVAKKVPLIAGIEIGVKQTYNAAEWLVSLNQIMDAHTINGKVMDAAKSLQNHIDDTYYELKNCH